MNTQPQPQPANAMQPRAPLPKGTPAPEFQLHTTPDQQVSPSDFRGQPLILAFYPADWSPVCSDQMVLYQEVMPEFKRHNAQVLGISVDSVWCHLAFAKYNNIHFPLLADFEPKGDAARAYNAYRTREGVSERSLFVIDPEGAVYWSYVSPVGVNPGADGILQALENMEKDGLSRSNP
jgi:peroxiredoxin